MNTRTVMSALVCIVVCALALPAAMRAADDVVGKTLPAMKLEPVATGADAGAVFDTKAAKGKWLVLDFLLQTACPFCARRVGEYAAIQSKIEKDDSTQLIIIKPDDAATIKAWTEQFKVKGPMIYRDPDALLAGTLQIPGGYQFHGQAVHYPATLIVSPEGKVVWANVGKSNSERCKVEDVLAALDGFRAKAPAGGTEVAATGVLGFTVNDIDNKPVDLKKFKGEVCLIVNVASKCGNTPQYKPMEDIYSKYHDKGFEILGFPANNFGAQEPGTNDQIKTFCTSKYKVTFPMFSKISVKGADIAPLYDYLVNKQPDEKLRGDVTWNFGKFLVSRKGEVIARFDPKVNPDAPEVTGAIEKALAEKP